MTEATGLDEELARLKTAHASCAATLAARDAEATELRREASKLKEQSGRLSKLLAEQKDQTHLLQVEAAQEKANGDKLLRSLQEAQDSLDTAGTLQSSLQSALAGKNEELDHLKQRLVAMETARVFHGGGRVSPSQEAERGLLSGTPSSPPETTTLWAAQQAVLSRCRQRGKAGASEAALALNTGSCGLVDDQLALDAALCVQERSRDTEQLLQHRLQQLEEASRKLTKCSVLGLAMEKGTRRVVTVMTRSPASRPLEGQAVNVGDELLAVNGTPYVPGLHSRDSISSASQGRRSAVIGGASADEVSENGGERDGGREVGDRNSLGKILPDADGRLMLRVRRIASEREEQVVCHLHKTLLETAEDDMVAVLEGARTNGNVSLILLGKLQKAADGLVSAASLTDAQARTALSDSIAKARQFADGMEISLDTVLHHLRRVACEGKRSDVSCVRSSEVQRLLCTKTQERRTWTAISALVLNSLCNARMQCAALETAWKMQERKATQQAVLTAWAGKGRDDVTARAAAECSLSLLVRSRTFGRCIRAWKQLMTLKNEISKRGNGLQLCQARNSLGLHLSFWVKRHRVHVNASAAADAKHGNFVVWLRSRAVSHWRNAARLQAKQTHELCRLRTVRAHAHRASSLVWWREWARKCKRISQELQTRVAGSRAQVLRQVLHVLHTALGSRARELRSLVTNRLGQWRLHRVLRLWRRAVRAERWVGINISRCTLRRVRALALGCCQRWRCAVAALLQIQEHVDKTLAASCVASSRALLGAWRSLCTWRVTSSAGLYQRFQDSKARSVLVAWCDLRGMRSGERTKVLVTAAVYTISAGRLFPCIDTICRGVRRE